MHIKCIPLYMYVATYCIYFFLWLLFIICFFLQFMRIYLFFFIFSYFNYNLELHKIIDMSTLQLEHE